MNTNWWLVRREFWENRAIWIVPAAIGALLVLAALFGKVDFAAIAVAAPSRAVGRIYLMAFGATFYVVMTIYAGWYLLDCLYADRKDRSILFWKSLPISDAKTVLCKLAVGLLVIPLVYFAAADLTTLLTAFIISLRARSTIGGALWHADLWLQMQALWLYVIVASAIWYMPIAAWFLVVSAWARRAVTLWALSPFLLCVVERWFFGTYEIWNLLAARFLGFAVVAFPGGGARWQAGVGGDAAAAPDVLRAADIGGFLSSPDVWIGVVVGVALLFGAIQVRLRRSEI